jgi:chromosome segregation ATPase
MIYELQRQLEKLRIENRKLEARANELEKDLRRYENAHLILCLENDHMKTKLSGTRNMHPDAIKCSCPECAAYAIE